MTEILLSLHQGWIAMMAAGLKDGELRKSWPQKLQPPFKVRLYCTKAHGSEVLLLDGEGGAELGDYQNVANGWRIGNGYVVGEFICTGRTVVTMPTYGITKEIKETMQRGRLTLGEIDKYIGREGTGYLWHMKDLVIYREPQPLWRYIPCCFEGRCGICDFWNVATRSCTETVRGPQSWCYIEGRVSV